MAEDVIVKTIKINTDQATKSLDSVSESTDGVTSSTKDLEGGLGKLPGPLGAVQAGVKGLSAAFKALLANPIVLLIAAIVLALAALFKAFTKTEEGADKMKQATEALAAVVDSLVDVMAKLFKALTLFARGKFREGIDEIKGAVDGLGQSLIDAANDAIAFEKATVALFEAETAVITQNAERQKQIAEQILLTRDLTLSVEERRDAIIKADALEKESLEANLELQTERVRLAEQEIKNTPELQRTREQNRKLAEEEAKLIGLQTQSINKQRSLKNRLITLDNEAAAANKARADEAAALAQVELDRLATVAAEKAAQQAELDKLENERLDALAAEDLARVNSLEKLKAEIRARTHEGRLENLRIALEAGEILEEEYKLRLVDLEIDHQEEILKEKELAAAAEQKIRDDADAADEQAMRDQVEREKQLSDVKKQIYQDSLTALMGFLGEGSKIGKAIAIADATKSAIQAAIAAYSSAAAIPVVGFVLGPIAAAAALAAGMANVRKIAQTPDPVGGGGGASVPSVTLAQPSQEIDPRDLINEEQGIGTDVNIIQDGTQRGAGKSYVVQSEVTAQQDIAAQREADVTL